MTGTRLHISHICGLSKILHHSVHIHGLIVLIIFFSFDHDAVKPCPECKSSLLFIQFITVHSYLAQNIIEQIKHSGYLLSFMTLSFLNSSHNFFPSHNQIKTRRDDF